MINEKERSAMIEHFISSSVNSEISVCFGGIRIIDGFPADNLCFAD